MNLLLTVGVLIVCTAYVQGFDLKGFVKDHCTLEAYRRDRVELKCSDFKFSKSVIDDIQSNEFIITNLTKMHFANCDIGIVNDNFFSKFPKVEEFRFNNVKFTTSPPTRDFILPYPLKVTEILISDGRMKHTQNCNFLGSMPELEYVYFGSVNVDFKTMDENFFQNNPKITWLNMKNMSFVSFEEGVFDNLEELGGIYLNNIKLEYIPKSLFTRNVKLKHIYMDNCGLEKVPELIYPKSLNSLILSNNNITVITAASFRNMENVTVLKLDNNNIHNFWLEVFDEMKNLTTVDLSNNKITQINKDHFVNLDEMALIDLRLNNIESTDLEEYSKVNVMLHPSKKEKKLEQEVEDEQSGHCGCGHAWLVLFLFLGIFAGGISFIAWNSSASPLRRVFGYKMTSMDDDDQSLL